MSEETIIIPESAKEEKKEPRVQTIVAFDVTEGVGGQVRINTTNEAFLALAVRRIGQVVDLYLAEQENKRIQEATRIVQSVLPPSVVDRIRG